MRAHLVPPQRSMAPKPRPKRRRRWSPRSLATSAAVSACWHLLALATLALAVHPFQLPAEPPPIDVELLPPLKPPVKVELQPKPEPTPQRPTPRQEIAPTPTPTAPIVPPEPPLPQARVEPPVVAKPVEIPRAPTPRARLDLQRPLAPPTPVVEAPPEPMAIARPAPNVLPKVVAVDRAAPARPALDRPAPALAAPQPVQAQAPPQAAAPVQVLTSDRVAPGPVVVRPPERKPGPALRTEGPALPALEGGPGAPGGGGGGGAAGGGRPAAAAGNIVGGFDTGAAHGLRLRLGCASPDTYHLTAAERAECLSRLADQAKTTKEMGINIPEAKQADYDRYVACHNAYTNQSTPTSTSDSAGASISGLGSNPSLRQCGPGDR
jgi:hypothetical protein